MKTQLTKLLFTASLLALTACQGQWPNGRDGASVVGPQGAAGANGIDADPVTVVQLCPGVDVYPSVLIETALCISGHLIAVYSGNGGYMFEMVPGTYSSNAIGSACNVTVLEDCVVQNE